MSRSLQNKYYQTVLKLSEALVQAQRPIRILDAIKWGREVERYFFKHKGAELPPINADYYARHNPLKFNPHQKKEEFQELELEIRRRLGEFSGVGSVMQRMCREYQLVVDMLLARGTPEFYRYSQILYGSANDAIHVGAPSLRDFGQFSARILSRIQDSKQISRKEKIFTSEEAAIYLGRKLSGYFKESDKIRVEVNDKIISDASAGADTIKLRSGIHFSKAELHAYEVHEGWVHLGTTLNGLKQPVCTFLSKGTPSSTITQEGLAILMEMFALASYPARVRRLINRINGVNMAEDGANFFDVYDYLRDQGYTEHESYHASVRIFRGSTFDGGPFTKDLAYSKGFMLTYNYIILAVQKGLLHRIPLLFVGKTSLDDIQVLGDLMDEGMIKSPKYLPKQFSDMSAISSWMIYSLFLNKLDMNQLALDFKGLLR